MWIYYDLFQHFLRNSPAVQGLGHCTSTVGGVGSIPGQGTEISHATRCGWKKKIWKFPYSCELYFVMINNMKLGPFFDDFCSGDFLKYSY